MGISRRVMALASAALLATSVLALPAGAQILDFNDLTTPITQDVGSSYEKYGFRITIAPDPSIAPDAYLLVWASDESLNADPGGATLTTGYSGNIVTLSAISGAAFRFDSIDLTDAFNGIFAGPKGDVAFELALAGGGSQALTISLADMPGLQHFSFGTDVTSVSFQGLTTLSQWVQFDNITLTGGNGVVPEPASWAMLIVGFGLVGAMLRRRERLPVA